jgi:hypothetical protein
VLLFALSGWSAIPFGMFDHSEYMGVSSVAKVLVLTEPHLMTLQERWRLIDAYMDMGRERGPTVFVWSWQAAVSSQIEYFKVQYDDDVFYALSDEERIMEEKIAEGMDYWEHYLETHGHSSEAIAYVENIRAQMAAVRELFEARNEACVNR